MQSALMNVRFEGKIGYEAGVTRCLLMTRSANTDPVLGDLNARSLELRSSASGQLGDSRCTLPRFDVFALLISTESSTPSPSPNARESSMAQDYVHPLQALRAVMVQKRRVLAESLLRSRKVPDPDWGLEDNRQKRWVAKLPRCLKIARRRIAGSAWCLFGTGGWH